MFKEKENKEVEREVVVKEFPTYTYYLNSYGSCPSLSITSKLPKYLNTKPSNTSIKYSIKVLNNKSTSYYLLKNILHSLYTLDPLLPFPIHPIFKELSHISYLTLISTYTMSFLLVYNSKEIITIHSYYRIDKEEIVLNFHKHYSFYPNIESRYL